MKIVLAFLVLLLTTSTSFVHGAVTADEEDVEDTQEVERILGATDIIQEITKQREKHHVQLIEIEMNMETEIKEFYKKHDSALSKLRTIDSELRQRVNNLESKVIAEAQNLKDRAPSYSSWLLPCVGLTGVVIGIYVWLGRKMSASVKDI
jgi:hypothetical protein